MERDELLQRLVDIRYERNDIAFERNMFRVRGDTVEIWPAYWKDTAIRVEFFGDEIDRISEINVVTGAPIRRLQQHAPIWPATHYVTPKEKMDSAPSRRSTRSWRSGWPTFETSDKLMEAQRIKQRTMYDVEMMQELGYCSGIENYSRVIDGRPAGLAPHDPAGLFPQGLCPVHRREPRHPAPGAGHVQRRPGPEGPPWWTTASACPAPLTTGR